MSRAPSLFVSHGSPMFAVEPGIAGPALARVGRTLAAITAIVVCGVFKPLNEVLDGRVGSAKDGGSRFLSLTP